MTKTSTPNPFYKSRIFTAFAGAAALCTGLSLAAGPLIGGAITAAVGAGLLFYRQQYLSSLNSLADASGELSRHQIEFLKKENAATWTDIASGFGLALGLTVSLIGLAVSPPDLSSFLPQDPQGYHAPSGKPGYRP